MFLLWPLRIILSALRFVTLFIGMGIAITVFVIHKRRTGSLIGGAWFHATCARCTGVRVHVNGTPAFGPGRIILFTPNHLSYLDIAVTGKVLKNSVFVAKAEIENWPVFGWMATVQNTVFIRRVRTAMESAIAEVTQQIAQGHNIILFPEGTTSDGSGVLPFKAGLFELAYVPSPHGKLLVQPVAITLDRIDGQRVSTQRQRDYYAWWRKEDTLLPHILKLGTRFGVDVTLHFLDTLDPMDFPDRKELAAAAEAAVRSTVEGNAAKDYKSPNVPVAQLDRASVS